MKEFCGQIWSIVKKRAIPAARPLHARRLALATALFVVALAQSQTAMAQTGGSNSPPYAQNDMSMTMEGTPVAVAVLTNDWGISAPLDPSSIQIITQPADGFVAIDQSTGHVWYFPVNEFWGVDSFTYTVSDTLGNISNVAAVGLLIMPDATPPVIQNFGVANPRGNSFTFSGTVIDDHPNNIRVNFGGVITGTVYTDQNGFFTLTVTVPPGTFGQASAQAVNDEGISSAIRYTSVHN